MNIGLAFDLKEDFGGIACATDDALEEYDSEATIELISQSLRSLDHQVVLLGGGLKALTRVISTPDIDIVFNIAEGRGNHKAREAQIPSMLEMLDIPYTGSGPQCLSICLDKPLTKKLVTDDGICTPAWQTIHNAGQLAVFDWQQLKFPLVIKPAYEGSSKGIKSNSIVNNADDGRRTVDALLSAYRQPALLEEYVQGEEVTSGMLGNNPADIFGIMHIKPKQLRPDFMYNLEVKRDYVNQVSYTCPPGFSPTVLGDIAKACTTIFKTLDCRDVARIDCIITPEGRPYFLEINPLPGLGSHSDLVIMAGLLGFKHQDIIHRILQAALDRYNKCPHA